MLISSVDMTTLGKKLGAGDEFWHWLWFTVGFSAVPFVINASCAIGNPKATLADIFACPPLLFLGFVLCGTLIERLWFHETRRGTTFHKLCQAALFLYIMATIVNTSVLLRYLLASSEAPTPQQRFPLFELSAADAIHVFSAVFVLALLVLSSLLYWYTYRREHNQLQETEGIGDAG